MVRPHHGGGGAASKRQQGAAAVVVVFGGGDGGRGHLDDDRGVGPRGPRTRQRGQRPRGVIWAVRPLSHHDAVLQQPVGLRHQLLPADRD